MRAAAATVALVCVVWASASQAGAQHRTWVSQFGTRAADQVRGGATDASGNAYVAGQTRGAFTGQVSAGCADAFVAKVDGSGSLVWAWGVALFGVDVYVSGYARPSAGLVYGRPRVLRLDGATGVTLWDHVDTSVDGVAHAVAEHSGVSVHPVRSFRTPRNWWVGGRVAADA